MRLNNIITLTTDFGLSDPFAGIIKGVMLGINPYLKFVDISHQIEPQNIFQAYYTLNFSYKYFPSGTVHLAVVDPGVGSIRRPILVESGDYYFVGPDNGIFSFIFKKEPPVFSSPFKRESGVSVFELTENRFFLPSISNTFHGRDIFASVAAHLSRGTEPSEFGKPLSNPLILNTPEPDIQENKICGEVIYIDRFGNLITNVSADNLCSFTGKLQMKIKDLNISPPCKSYSDAGESKLSSIFNSWGLLEIFIKNGNAWKELKIKIGKKVQIFKYKI